MSDACIKEQLDAVDDPLCFIFITPEGSVLAKETWTEKGVIDKRTQFRVEHAALWRRYVDEDLYLTEIDIHS